MTTLDINTVAELQRLERPGLHGNVRVFIGVDILSKIEEAIFGKLVRLAVNYGSHAKRSRDAVLGRESVIQNVTA